MNSRLRLLAVVAIAAALIVSFLLTERHGPQAPVVPEASASPIESSSSRSIADSDFAIVRTTQSSAGNKEAPPVSEIKLLWSGTRSPSGVIRTYDGMKEIPLFDVENKKGERIVGVDPGTYMIELSDSWVASPQVVTLGLGRVEVVCTAGWKGVIALENNPWGDVSEVTVLSNKGRGGAWETLGHTDTEGKLAISHPSGGFRIAFIKAGSFFFLEHDAHFEDEPVMAFSFDAESTIDTQVSVVDAQNNKPIPNASIQLGDFALGRSDVMGTIEIRTSLNPWGDCIVYADGYQKSKEIRIVEDSGQTRFSVELSRNSGMSIVVHDLESGIPVANAHVLCMSFVDGAFHKLHWEVESNQDGKIIVPFIPKTTSKVFAWSPGFGFTVNSMEGILESGAVFLETSPPLEFTLDSAEPDVRFASCRAWSFWGEPLEAVVSENGDRLKVPSALGTEFITLRLTSGELRKLTRSGGFRGKASFGASNVLLNTTGKIEVTSNESFPVSGRIIGHVPGTSEKDILAVRIWSNEVAKNNYRQWPELRGCRPSTLDGWVWADQNVRHSATVNAEGAFQFQGVSAGTYNIEVFNQSSPGRATKVKDPEKLYLPAMSELEILFGESASLDWIILAGDTGEKLDEVFLEYTDWGDFGPWDSKFKGFFNGEIHCQLLLGLSQIRVSAEGYQPLDIILNPDDGGRDKRTVRLSSIEPMKIQIVDKRSVRFEGKLVADSGWFNDEGGFMAPVTRSEFWLDETVAELRFWGPFPGCDVWLSSGEGFNDVILSPQRLVFSPGEVLSVTLSDSP